jgi:predicted RNA-binding protein YlxR (DUF448 family)/ribosomal protein L7Ae-like RNA K-turn-binding protein
MAKEAPQRSCLGCRTVKGKSELLRFVLDPDRALVPDLLTKLPGRGAYTCLNAGCLRQALARRQFQRAFKGEVTALPADEMVSLVAGRMLGHIENYLALANKAGKVVSGTDTVLDSLRRKTAGLIIMAQDTAPESARRVRDLAERIGTPCQSLANKDRLGELLGKELRSVVAILHGPFVAVLLHEITRFRDFFDEGGAS